MTSPLSSILRSPIDLIAGTYDVLGHRKTRRFWYIPFVLGILSSIIAGSLLFAYRSEYFTLVKYVTPWQATWLEWISGFIAWVISLFLVGLLALVISTLLGAFFVESIVDTLLERNEVTTNGSQTNFFSALRRTLADEVVRIVFVFPLVLLAALLSFIPPLSILCFLLAALLVGFEIFELPLIKLQYSFKERLQYCRQHLSATLALGSLASVGLLVPFLGPTFIPFFHAAAVRAIMRETSKGRIQ